MTAAAFARLARTPDPWGVLALAGVFLILIPLALCRRADPEE